MDSDLWCLHPCVMANLNICVTCLLLLSWNWRAPLASPVRPRSATDCSNCTTLFKSLLINVSNLLKNDVLWHGIQTDKMRLTSPSGTVLACAPDMKITRCPIQKNGPFNESECLKNIVTDLAHYEAIISSYIGLELRNQQAEVPPLKQTLEIIRNLTHACSFTPAVESLEQGISNLWGNNTFSNRQNMLMIMRAFHIRTITFNRAMGYMASGEYKHNSPLQA